MWFSGEGVFFREDCYSRMKVRTVVMFVFVFDNSIRVYSQVDCVSFGKSVDDRQAPFVVGQLVSWNEKRKEIYVEITMWLRMFDIAKCISISNFAFGYYT